MEAGDQPSDSARPRPPCVLIVFRRPPFGSVMAVEGLRMAEALLAFQVPVKVVFTEDGVLCLLEGQGKGALGMGDLGKAFAGLPSMGLSRMMVVKEDLEGRGLSPGDLVEAPITMIPACQLRKEMEEANVVIPF